MTLDATMIENSPEMRKMYLSIASKQESPLVFRFKYVRADQNEKNPQSTHLEFQAMSSWRKNHYSVDGLTIEIIGDKMVMLITNTHRVQTSLSNFPSIDLFSFRYSNDFV